VREFRRALDLPAPAPLSARADDAAKVAYVNEVKHDVERLTIALLVHVDSIVDVGTINMTRLTGGLARFGTDVTTFAKFDAMVLQLEAAHEMQQQAASSMAAVRSSAVSAARNATASVAAVPRAAGPSAAALLRSAALRPAVAAAPAVVAASEPDERRARSRSRDRRGPSGPAEARRKERIDSGEWPADHPMGLVNGGCSTVIGGRAHGQYCGSTEHCKYDCPSYTCYKCNCTAPGHGLDFCPSEQSFH
jgi:hypothetical protein